MDSGLSYRSLYLHIPFCRKRCAYCDFVTEALPADDVKMDRYLNTLLLAFKRAARAGELAHVQTIYLGGGTPSYFGQKRLVELCYLISLTLPLEHIKEYTLEANPDSLTPALVKDLFALGVDRLSLGVQSFVDAELQTLGRIHDASAASQAFTQARERFENISLDLMCGIPGQTPESWEYSLLQALALDPEHLSIYPLQLEEHTPLALAIEAGELEEVSEDEQADFLEQAASVLCSAGYHRYEVASYAKEGRESLHNTTYWSGHSYLGLGTGAASMKNLPEGGRKRWLTDEEAELLIPKEAAAEDLMLAMRMSKGIAVEEVTVVESLLPHAGACFEELAGLGLVTYAEGRYLPTQKGWLLGNELFERIWALAEA